MTRKDTILIAVVINAGLLAILFMTAVIYDTDSVVEPSTLPPSLADNQLPQTGSRSDFIALASSGDEVDNVLQYYNAPVTQSLVVAPFKPEGESPLEDITAPFSEQFVEVKIKRGDVLEKIAKAHRTTVNAIKKVNQLENERLSIGQVLKIPLASKDPLLSRSLATEREQKEETAKISAEHEPVYYVIKSGDNPWKIAKQFGVKYDEILRLNQLDEEKARNLKIGDRVRVK